MKRFARTWFEQFRGLMFDNTPDAELEYEFQKPMKLGASVHTCFMKYPIDIEWLNEKRQVVDRKTLKPWVLNYTPKVPAKYIIERRVKE